eukprot:scaffold2239_cov187-Pinguiococcus_pyrenoidosus.AAC.2
MGEGGFLVEAEAKDTQIASVNHGRIAAFLAPLVWIPVQQGHTSAVKAQLPASANHPQQRERRHRGDWRTKQYVMRPRSIGRGDPLGAQAPSCIGVRERDVGASSRPESATADCATESSDEDAPPRGLSQRKSFRFRFPSLLVFWVPLLAVFQIADFALLLAAWLALLGLEQCLGCFGFPRSAHAAIGLGTSLAA